MHGIFTIILFITVSLNKREREREESFQVILMLVEFENKTISGGHPLLKMRTVFVNLGGIQCYTFLIQGKTCHYLYPNLESWCHVAFVTPPIHPPLLWDIMNSFVCSFGFKNVQTVLQCFME